MSNIITEFPKDHHTNKCSFIGDTYIIRSGELSEIPIQIGEKYAIKNMDDGFPLDYVYTAIPRLYYDELHILLVRSVAYITYNDIIKYSDRLSNFAGPVRYNCGICTFPYAHILSDYLIRQIRY